MFMPDSVLGTTRAGAARLAVIFVQRGRFALPVACLSTVLGVCSPHVVYGAEPEEGVVEVIVTGTRLGSANTTSASPIAVVDSEELQHLGTPRTEDLINSLPQVNSTLTLGANGAAVAPVTGTATADLRGIGAFRTLVLINGRRAAPGDTINPSARNVDTNRPDTVTLMSMIRESALLLIVASFRTRNERPSTFTSNATRSSVV